MKSGTQSSLTLDSKLDNKLDTMFSMFKEELQKQRRTANGDNFSDSDTEHTSQRRVTKGQKQSQRHVESDHENGLSDDNISLQPGQTECNDLQIDIESDVKDHEGENLHVSDKTRKCLFELFGEDAIAKKTEKKCGIELDDSQKGLNGPLAYRNAKPYYSFC